MDRNPPEWDEEDKARSFAAIADDLNETARYTFLKDGSHVQLAFVVKENGEMGMLPVMTGAPAAFHQMVKASVKRLRPYGVIHISECWTYLRRSLTDPLFDKVAKGTIKVSDLGPLEKTEALMVRAETRERASITWLNPIVRGTGPNVKLALCDAIRLDQPAMGMLSSFFD